MFEVSTTRGDREFNNFDQATAWARFLHSAYNMDNIMITHEGNTWQLCNWYGKPKFIAVA
jgi:hypothetical protein